MPLTPALFALSLPLMLAAAQEPGSAAPSSARLAWGDVDGDGLSDVLAIAADGRAALLLNAGDGSFQDHSAPSGIDLGAGLAAALWGDPDGDGRLDLLTLGLDGPGRLWRNLGQGTFSDATSASGLEIPAGASGLEWLDYDRDERPDLAVTTPRGELLFHNAGSGRFEAVDLLVAAEPNVVTVVDPAVAEQPPAPGGAAGSGTGSGSKAGAVSSAQSPPVPTGGSVASSPWCPPSLEDSAFPGNCIPASTVPLLGALLPLGPEFYVSPGGNVGIGTTSPNAQLAVAGRIRGASDVIADGQLRSFATAVPPLEVQSSQRVPNLNADLLDGVEASAFSQLGASIEGSEITDGTVTAADLGPDSVGPYALMDGSVGSSELAFNSVSSSKIANGSITASDLATGAATGAVIADGAITDADVSSTAAIAGSKIDPLFTAPVGIGTTTPGKALDVVGDIRASGLVSGQGSWSSNPNANSTVTALNTGTGGAGYFEVKNSSSNAEALRVLSNGLGRAAFLSTTNVNSTDPVIEAGTFGNGEVLYGVTYGKAPAAHLEVQNSTSTASGAVYVKTNGRGDGIQVHHDSSATTEGVYVLHTGGNGWGVWSRADGANGIGVRGESTDANSYGVFGGSPNIGLVGACTTSSGVAILSIGDLSVSGSKNFVQPHPTDASKEVVFTCLEGNESGTYFRGTAKLSRGRAVIEVPEEFRLVSADDGLSVQLTPVGRRAVLWVEHQDLDQVVVRGDADVTFHYQVHGVRRGFGESERIRDARVFVPELRGVPFGSQYPAELRQVLVDNGTLNPDFTPNEATAAARGWTLREPGERDLPMLEAAGLLPQGFVHSVPEVEAPAPMEVQAAEPEGDTAEPPPVVPHSSAPGERVPVPAPAKGGGA